MSPPFSQRLEAGQRGTGIISVVDDRPRCQSRGQTDHCIQHGSRDRADVHFRAFTCLNQLVRFSNRKKEETSILLARIIVFQGSIIILPVSDPEFDQAVLFQQGIGNAAFLLEMLQDEMA